MHSLLTLNEEEYLCIWSNILWGVQNQWLVPRLCCRNPGGLHWSNVKSSSYNFKTRLTSLDQANVNTLSPCACGASGRVKIPNEKYRFPLCQWMESVSQWDLCSHTTSCLREGYYQACHLSLGQLSTFVLVLFTSLITMQQKGDCAINWDIF